MKGIKGGVISGFRPGVRLTIAEKTDGSGFEYMRGRPAAWRTNAQTDILNRYYEQGGQRQITRVYSNRSKVIQSIESNIAVQYKDVGGKLQRGWLDTHGYLVGENEILTAIKALDAANGKDAFDEDSLQWAYLHASLKDQAKMAANLLTENWDHIFNEVLYDETSGKYYKADEATIDAVHRAVMARMTSV